METFLALVTALTLLAPGPLLSVVAVDTSGGSGREAQVVSETAATWEASLGARRTCSAGVTVVFEDLPNRRGEYRPASRTVVVDVGRPLDALPATVSHELAHHTFLACGAFADPDLTDRFYAAQGLPTSRGWFDYGAGWAATPAEQFAETLALVTTGRAEGGVRVTATARRVVAAWLAGSPLPTVTPPAAPSSPSGSPPPATKERETTSPARAPSPRVVPDGAEVPARPLPVRTPGRMHPGYYVT